MPVGSMRAGQVVSTDHRTGFQVHVRKVDETSRTWMPVIRNDLSLWRFAKGVHVGCDRDIPTNVGYSDFYDLVVHRHLEEQPCGSR